MFRWEKYLSCVSHVTREEKKWAAYFKFRVVSFQCFSFSMKCIHTHEYYTFHKTKASALESYLIYSKTKNKCHQIRSSIQRKMVFGDAFRIIFFRLGSNAFSWRFIIFVSFNLFSTDVYFVHVALFILYLYT